MLGRDHPDLTGVLVGLGILYAGQGKSSEAEPLFERAIAVRERAFGPQHPTLAAPVAHLGTLRMNKRRYAEAEALYKRVLVIIEQARVPRNREMAIARSATLRQPSWKKEPRPASPVSKAVGRKMKTAIITLAALAVAAGAARAGNKEWTGIGPDGGRVSLLAIHPQNPNTRFAVLYVGREGGGVFKSLDAGDHCFAVNSGPDELTVIGLAMDPSNPAVLYASASVLTAVTGSSSGDQPWSREC